MDDLSLVDRDDGEAKIPGIDKDRSRVIVDSWAWIDASALTTIQKQSLRYSLTVKPRKVGDFPGPDPEIIKLYVERENLIGVARDYFFSKAQRVHDIDLQVCMGDKTHWPGELQLNAILRDEQTKALDSVVNQLRGVKLGGIVRAAPGWGKTVWACALMAELQVPTLVVVHKEFLMNQWRERIETFLPNAKIGRVQQDECDFQGKHVALGMVHSLSGKDYPSALYKWPGLIIIDEVHRIGSHEWSKVPPKFPARWRVGLSATPRRKDGADNVFLYHIGQVLYSAKEQRMKPKVRRVQTSFRLIKTPRINPGLVTKSMLLKFLCASDPRNQQITEQLILAARTGRKCLVLSERLEHLRTLESLLNSRWPVDAGTKPTIGHYIGGLSEEALENAARCQVIFATSQLVTEGLDIPALDTLFLTTPLGDIEQATGRILRPCEGKKEPIVVDFLDKVPLCERLAEMRERQYSRIAA